VSVWAQGSIFVAALAVLVLVVWLLPVVAELRRTIRAAHELLRGVERDLGPALSDLRVLMKNLSRTAETVQGGVTRLQGAVGAVEEVAETVRFLNDLGRKSIAPRLATFAGFLVGTRTGLRFLIRSLLGRK
jgi:uncharacterized protein YoxC